MCECVRVSIIYKLIPNYYIIRVSTKTAWLLPSLSSDDALFRPTDILKVLTL